MSTPIAATGTAAAPSFISSMINKLPSAAAVQAAVSGFFEQAIDFFIYLKDGFISGLTSLKGHISSLPKEGVIGGIAALVAIIVTTVLCCRNCKKTEADLPGKDPHSGVLPSSSSSSSSSSSATPSRPSAHPVSH